MMITLDDRRLALRFRVKLRQWTTARSSLIETIARPVGLIQIGKAYRVLLAFEFPPGTRQEMTITAGPHRTHYIACVK